MLVLSRKLLERIIVNTPEGREIIISVERIEYDRKVRIGIEADKDVSVHREEIKIAIDREKRRDGGTSP